jgi:hypothetical protein
MFVRHVTVFCALLYDGVITVGRRQNPQHLPSGMHAGARINRRDGKCKGAD